MLTLHCCFKQKTAPPSPPVIWMEKEEGNITQEQVWASEEGHARAKFGNQQDVCQATELLVSYQVTNEYFTHCVINL